MAAIKLGKHALICLDWLASHDAVVTAFGRYVDDDLVEYLRQRGCRAGPAVDGILSLVRQGLVEAVEWSRVESGPEAGCFRRLVSTTYRITPAGREYHRALHA